MRGHCPLCSSLLRSQQGLHHVEGGVIPQWSCSNCYHWYKGRLQKVPRTPTPPLVPLKSINLEYLRNRLIRGHRGGRSWDTLGREYGVSGETLRLFSLGRRILRETTVGKVTAAMSKGIL